MNWLHTWLGIGLATILYAIFFMGSLTVFHLEINKWMKPELRFGANIDAPLDPVVMPVLQSLELKSEETAIVFRPNERMPYTRLLTFGGEDRFDAYYHPETGEKIEQTKSLGASEFFIPSIINCTLAGSASVIG